MKNFIWFEKFRPNQLDEMVLPSSTIDTFKSFIENEEIPHLLLHGIQGSGKTSIAKILINSIPCTSMVLNASSSDRGIETVKGKIKNFASSKTEIGKKIKIIFLDEFHSMTLQAQEALKNTMETYSSNCRFILTANEISKVIDPIRSRCMLFEFSSFPKDSLFNLCCDILDNENVKFEDDNVDAIIDRLYPDIRSVVNNLQKCSISGKLDISGLMSFNISIDEIIKLIKNGELRKLRESWAGSGSFFWIYNILFNKFIESVKDSHKPQIALIIGEFLHRDSTIADKEINVSACLVQIMVELEIEILW